MEVAGRNGLSARSDRSEPTLRDKIRKFMLEPYLDWAEGEGVPIYEGFAIDMLSIETTGCTARSAI